MLVYWCESMYRGYKIERGPGDSLKKVGKEGNRTHDMKVVKELMGQKTLRRKEHKGNRQKDRQSRGTNQK